MAASRALQSVEAASSSLQRSGRSDFEKAIVEEKADGLRLMIGVRACSPFVAVFGKRAEIVLADVNRQPLNAAARPFSVRSHSLGGCSHGGLPLSGDGARKSLPKA